MNRDAESLWERAQRAARTASTLVEEDPDAAASRAYYAAFYAVSALFAKEDRFFSRHRAVEAAVHRDLVREGRWSQTLGKAYSSLRRLRSIGDYGTSQHVSARDAAGAVKNAEMILEAVAKRLGER